jgi:hypothetical protein
MQCNAGTGPLLKAALLCPSEIDWSKPVHTADGLPLP